MPISSVVSAASLTGIPAEKICQIPSFIADEVFADAECGPRPDFLPAGPFVLFVGALGEHKGMSLLAEAHARMRVAVPLVVIGSVRSDTREWKSTPERPVTLRTGVPHHQIMVSFAAATVAVVPSRWQEPLGLVAVEAMAAGTPVVVTRVGALPEVVTDGRTGLVVEPGNAGALAEALDKVVGDPVLQKRYGAAGRARARTFTASSIMPKVLEGYRRAVGTMASSWRL
jgi:glycosyltransferase involved in cell wall biosynthesis